MTEPSETHYNDKISEARKPGPVTRDWLNRAAQFYLARYASSQENLRRVLRRKVERRALLRGEEFGPFLILVDEVVEKAAQLALVDDAKFAQARIVSLRQKGLSARAIVARLAHKGLDRELVKTALAKQTLATHALEIPAEQADGEDAEEQAARRFAERRKLGSWRREGLPVPVEKEWAKMMRAGFSLSLARKVLKTEP
jgi:regulatory protein